ncbi:uncharacterized protein UTRI_00877_B [Ustilago trichophora]|uniref:Uncharacterized protein n=1 Tax=Ustilago trichophora TaxID=86804 RepID=A0A5C3DSY1_9BASI|nr:uncharacterized protein UTRI_00877_B [Ustilago trichophora]
MQAILHLAFIHAILHLFAILTHAAPLPQPPVEAVASLTDSIKSFESTFSAVNEKIAHAAERRKKWTTREKWLAGIGTALTTVGTVGFVAAPSVQMSVNHRQEEKLRELRELVAQANARAGYASVNARLDRGIRIRKRGPLDGLEKLAQKVGLKGGKEDGESFVSALSRTSSKRLSDFNEHEAHLLKPSQEVVKQYKTLTRSNSAPLYFYPSSSPHKEPLYPLHSTTTSTTESYESTIHDRLSWVETAILDLKEHQHDQQKLSPFTKFLIGLGVVNAAGTVVSAELSVQNTIEAANKKRKKNSGEDALPDVTNLDRETCEKFMGQVDGLDCSKAQGKASSG